MVKQPTRDWYLSRKGGKQGLMADIYNIGMRWFSSLLYLPRLDNEPKGEEPSLKITVQPLGTSTTAEIYGR